MWRKKNHEFEDFLQKDPNLIELSSKMFHVWDGNHRLQPWFPYIERAHPKDEDWHICVESFVLDTRDGLVELLTVMPGLNK